MKHENRCNRSTSQRASRQYAEVPGHVTYAPFIDKIPWLTTRSSKLKFCQKMAQMRRNHSSKVLVNLLKLRLKDIDLTT